MLPQMSLLLLLFVQLSLFSLLSQPSSSECFCIPSFILKNRFVIDVFQSAYFVDQSFSVMRNLFIEFVVLQINHCNIVHFSQNFVNKFWSTNFIALNIQTRNTLAFQQACQITQSIKANTVVFQQQIRKSSEVLETLDSLNHIIAQIEVAYLCELVESFDGFNYVLLKIETAQIYKFLEILDFFNTITLQVQHLESYTQFMRTCVKFEIVNFFKTFVMQIKNVVQFGCVVVEFEIRFNQLLEKAFSNHSLVLLVRFNFIHHYDYVSIFNFKLQIKLPLCSHIYFLVLIYYPFQLTLNITMQNSCYCRSCQLYATQKEESFYIQEKKHLSKRKFSKSTQVPPQIIQELEQANQLWLPPKINKISIDQIVVNPMWFYKQYCAKNIPVIIMNSLDGSDICERWSDQKYLQEALGKQQLSVSLTPDGFADSIKGDYFVEPEQIKTKISSFFNCQQELPNSIPYIQHQNNNLTQQLSGLQAEVPQEALQMLSQNLFEGKMPQAQNLWLGRRQSVSALHKDPYQNFYTTIVGQKHFTLIPPSGILRMDQFTYKKAKWNYNEGQFKLEADKEEGQTKWIACNPDLPSDLQIFPLLKNIPKYHVILQAEEMLYLPSLWYHQVAQEHPKNDYSLAINYWFDMEFTQNYSFYQLCRSIKSL